MKHQLSKIYYSLISSLDKFISYIEVPSVCLSMFKFLIGVLASVGLSFSLLSSDLTNFDFQTQKMTISVERAAQKKFQTIEATCSGIPESIVQDCLLAKYQTSAIDRLSNIMVRYVVASLAISAILFFLCLYSWLRFALKISQNNSFYISMFSFILFVTLWTWLTH